MTGRLTMALGVLSISGLSAAMDDAGLPKWNGNERKELEAAGWIAGAALLTDEPIPDEPKLEAPAALNVEQPTAEEIADDAKPSPVIPEQFLPAYFAERPKSFLIDPQGLLSPSDYRDRLSFLNYHAGDSSIDLFVYVMGGDQEIPSEVREEEMIERFFSEGRPAAIVYYYLGAPQRSVVYLSPSLTDSVSAAEQRRALASSVVQAFEKINASEQIEAFLVQMSIRIYWMERMLGTAPVTVEGMPVISRRAESAPGPGLDRNEKLERAKQLAGEFGTPAGVLVGSLLAAVCMAKWVRRRARYEFPDFDVEPRLGGAHAAGVGAVISFASAAVPPASQRDQVPDYLRRA
jgi:hypothetical protein